jgi:hypothetical protein
MLGGLNMKIKSIMSLKAIFGIFLSLGFLFLTQTVMSLFGMTVNSSGITLARLLGQMYFLMTLLLWFCRNTSEATTKNAFAISITIGDAIGAVVCLMAVLSGAVNSLGWLPVAIYLFFTIAFGYFVVRPETG